ncbi:CHASE3 domain-containing protein [Spirosoma humi]
MRIPPFPDEESNRLEALKRYDILDSIPEQAYDDLVKLASQICQMPVSLISLLGEKRQWFKASYGIDIRETPREYAFCSYHELVDPEEALVVMDSREDERFASNPFVTGEPHVVFYAGVPLIDSDGFMLGSLCIIDHQPRQISQPQLDALKILAKQVVSLLELRRFNKALKQSEERYAALSAELEQQVKQRTQELATANEALLTSNNLLSRSNENLQQFAYIASHDLQEPLRKVQSFGDLLKDQYADQIGGGVVYLERMQGAAARMSTLIRDLLSYSRIHTQRETTAEVSLNEVVKAVLIDLELTIANSGADVQVGPLPTVPGDASQLGQLFQNLLTNALKFRRNDTQPIIQVTARWVSADHLPAGRKTTLGSALAYHCIEVSDNGIGFDEKYVDRIFQIFQRLHGKSEFDGTGIGLAVCEKVAANHGGFISARSEAGHGATFSLFLPCS